MTGPTRNTYSGSLTLEGDAPLLDAIAVGLAVADADGRLRTVNRAFCTTVGRDPRELIGLSLWSLPGDTREGVLSSDELPATMHHEWPAPGGGTVPITLELRAIEGASGNVLGIVATCTPEPESAASDESSAPRSGQMFAADPEWARLTSPREREVVEQLLLDGNLELVAKNLNISLHTVRNHLKSVYRKLGVHSRQELVVRLLKNEL